MSVVCPYCNHRMRVKGARAGRFLPECDRCRGRFLLVMAAEPDVAPMVMGLEADRRREIEGHGKWSSEGAERER